MNWHRCLRWTRRKIPCPYQMLAQHEQTDDEPDDDAPQVPVAPPAKKGEPPPEKKEPVGERQPVLVPALEKGDKKTPEKEDVIEQAEKIIRGVPKPVPAVVGPVGNIQPALAGLDPGLVGRPGRSAAGKAAAKGAGKVGPQAEPASARRLVRGAAPEVAVAAAVAMKELTGALAAPPPVRVLELIEEVIVQEFVPAEMPTQPVMPPLPKSSAFKLTNKQIGGAIAGAAGGVAIAAGAGKFVFNAQQRLAALMGQ